MPKTGELCASYISGYLKTEKFDMRNPESKPVSGIWLNTRSRLHIFIMLSKRYWNLSCTKKGFLYQSELEITSLQKHYKNWLDCENEVIARVSITSYIRSSSLSGRKIICMHLTCFQSSITICVDSSHGQHDLRGQGMTESSHHSARTSLSVLPTVKTLKYHTSHIEWKSIRTTFSHCL